jgi:predicted DCC family thiol-disulfide oxidoreductase YuxK
VTDGPHPSRGDGIGRTLTVIYDGACPVCRLTIRALRILDWRQRLAFTPLQQFLPRSSGDPSRRELMRALHVRDGRGRWNRGGDAALQVASVVPILVPLSLVGRLPGLQGPVEAAYRLVADHRQAISRLLDAVVDPLRRGGR